MRRRDNYTMEPARTTPRLNVGGQQPGQRLRSESVMETRLLQGNSGLTLPGFPWPEREARRNIENIKKGPPGFLNSTHNLSSLLALCCGPHKGAATTGADLQECWGPICRSVGRRRRLKWRLLVALLGRRQRVGEESGHVRLRQLTF